MHEIFDSVNLFLTQQFINHPILMIVVPPLIILTIGVMLVLKEKRQKAAKKD